MLRPIDTLSSESFVGVAAVLVWFESKHGKLFESVQCGLNSNVNSKQKQKKTKKKKNTEIH